MNLKDILPNQVYGCCQSKEWMDERSMKLCIELVWKFYVEGVTKLVICLEDFTCHKPASVIKESKSLGFDVNRIPGGYISILQPCNVGVVKMFKGDVRKECMEMDQ